MSGWLDEPGRPLCAEGSEAKNAKIAARKYIRTLPLWRRHDGLELPLLICRVAGVVVILNRLGSGELLVCVRICVRRRKYGRIFPRKRHRQHVAAFGQAKPLDEMRGFLGASSTRGDEAGFAGDLKAEARLPCEQLGTSRNHIGKA